MSLEAWRGLVVAGWRVARVAGVCYGIRRRHRKPITALWPGSSPGRGSRRHVIRVCGVYHIGGIKERRSGRRKKWASSAEAGDTYDGAALARQLPARCSRRDEATRDRPEGARVPWLEAISSGFAQAAANEGVITLSRRIMFSV